MYNIDNTIKIQEFSKLQVQKIIKTSVLESLSISVEKEVIFPEHTASTNAQLIVLDGNIFFHINNESVTLSTQQQFSFSKEVIHRVEAKKNSNFLIIR